MAATDYFKAHEYLPPGPCRRVANVTPDNENELDFMSRFLYIGVGGDVTVSTSLDANVTFENVPDGTILPIEVKKVLSDGTTADSIVAMA